MLLSFGSPRADSKLKLSEEKYNNFLNLDTTIHKGRTYLNRTFFDSGIDLAGRKTYLKDGRYFLHLIAKVNFQKLLEPHDLIRLYTEDDISKAIDNFDSMLGSFGIDLPDFLEWSVIRTDYAVNLETEFLETYLGLAYKSNLPVKEPESFKRRTSSCWVHTNGYNVNIYDKFSELQYRNADLHYRDFLEDRFYQQEHNILRVEIQDKNPRLNYLHQKYKKQARIEDFCKYPDLFLTRERAETELLTRLSQMFISDSPFLSLTETKKLLNKQHFTRKKYDRLLKTIVDISKRNNSIWKLISESDNPRLLKRDLKTLSELKINPIVIPEYYFKEVIPKNLVSDLRKNGIPSLQTLVQNELDRPNNIILGDFETDFGITEDDFMVCTESIA